MYNKLHLHTLVIPSLVFQIFCMIQSEQSLILFYFIGLLSVRNGFLLEQNKKYLIHHIINLIVESKFVFLCAQICQCSDGGDK